MAGNVRWSEHQSRKGVIVPHICFIHVGKCGGGEFGQRLHVLYGKTDSVFIQKAEDWLRWKRIASKAKLLRIHATRLMRGHPLTGECSNRRLVVLLVCDPVQRLISSFRYGFQDKGAQIFSKTGDLLESLSLDPGKRNNLEYIASAVASKKNKSLADRFVHSFAHGHACLSWYLNGDCSVLDNMTSLFVARREHFDDDYNALLRYINVSQLAQDGHQHSTRSSGVDLSDATVRLFRELDQTQADYGCLHKLAERCLLDEDYVDQVVQNGRYVFL